MTLGEKVHAGALTFNPPLTMVKIAGVDVPVKFGNLALDEVQVKYGTLQEYERKLKGIPTQDDALKQALETLTGGKTSSSPVTDGLIAMVHCGCLAKGYDLAGTTDGEIAENIEMNYFDLRALVIAEFNKAFAGLIEEDPPKKTSRTKKRRSTSSAS
jgi:hypothetical protein